MKILSCKPQHGSYMELSLDNGQIYDIHREIACKYNLTETEDISEDTLIKMLFDNDARRAFHRALYLLEGQSYSYHMMFLKLRGNYEEEVCYEVMDRLTELGVINDWKYAENTARRAAEIKLYGPRRIRQILFQKGIPKSVIDKAVAPYTDAEYQTEQITQLLYRKYSRLLDDISDRKKIEKCKAALVRMGYGYSPIAEAVRLYFENEESE